MSGINYDQWRALMERESKTRDPRDSGWMPQNDAIKQTGLSYTPGRNRLMKYVAEGTLETMMAFDPKTKRATRWFRIIAKRTAAG